MRNFTALSDVEFEHLCADLLQEDLQVPVERFPAGRDQGIDLRWKQGSNQGIGQCKHYAKSTFSDLQRSATAEVSKVKALAPSRYIFMTSRSLSPSQKEKIYELFKTWMESSADVWSGEDVDGRLTLHHSVERRHIKLWLNSGSELFAATHSGLLNRSAALAERAMADLAHFVPTTAFKEAAELLHEQRVCLIAGAPGVGKTMLAHALIASSLHDGYEPVEISSDITDGWDALDREAKQFFIYDDFLGQISFSERLGKKEDERLVDFIQLISRSKKHRFVLTTRQYVLQDAEQIYPLLTGIEQDKRFILSIPAYSRIEKGEILYSHLWHSKLPREMKSQLSDGGWKRIVDHKNYSPRLIQYATGDLLSDSDNDYLQEFIGVLDHPRQLWSHAYDNHLSELEQLVLLTLCSFEVAPSSRLSAATAAHMAGTATFTARKFSRALKALDQTFIRTIELPGGVGVTFHSPAVREFMLDILRDDGHTLGRLVSSADSLSQLWYLAKAGTGVRTFNPLTLKSETTASNLLPLSNHKSAFSTRVKELFVPIPSNSSDAETPSRGLALSELISLDPQLRPDERWLTTQYELVAEDWSKSIGTAPNALRLLEHTDSLGIPASITSSLRAEVISLLNQITLEEDTDWSAAVEIYREVLEKDFPPQLFREFEEYVSSEISAQGMTIGNLNELREIAEDIQAENALQDIEEHEIRMDQYAESQDEEGYHGSASGNDRDHSGILDSMFDRFAE